MRISDAAWLMLGLAGCSTGAPPAKGGEQFDCALAGAASFTHDCTLERASKDGATLLIVRRPDGGFRRFTLQSGSANLSLADGAGTLAIAKTSDGVDVSVDGDRYRFPAGMLGDDRR